MGDAMASLFPEPVSGQMMELGMMICDAPKEYVCWYEEDVCCLPESNCTWIAGK
jgi:hypothetical protein